MATTSIWRVNGWLGKVVVYVENPDKTTNPQFFRKQDMTEKQTQSLSDVIGYAVDSNKTQAVDDETLVVKHSFVSGISCHPGTAREEMLAVKKRFGKENGTVAYHGYQSFAPGEATPEMVHEIGVKLAQQLWGEKYQVLVATHLDKESHLHNHFIVNTVSFVDGIKYHRTNQDYRDMQQVSDALCREYGLSVIDDPQNGKAKQYGEWRAELEQRPTWRGIIRADIDEAILWAMTERQFFENLRRKGYEVKIGKDISVRPPGKPRFVRLARNFGAGYTIEGIRRRILAQNRAKPPKTKQPLHQRRYRVRGNLFHARRITGLRALYFHYCYLLGAFPKKQTGQSAKRMHFLLREDLAKLNTIISETKLLSRCQIDTAEQLFSYRTEQQDKISSLTAERKELYRIQRTAAVRADPQRAAEIKKQITAISGTLAGLRKEVMLCDDIAVRSGVIAEKIETVQTDTLTQEKEMRANESIRRRGGTSRAFEP